jgi:hypothetical protein
MKIVPIGIDGLGPVRDCLKNAFNTLKARLKYISIKLFILFLQNFIYFIILLYILSTCGSKNLGTIDDNATSTNLLIWHSYVASETGVVILSMLRCSLVKFLDEKLTEVLNVYFQNSQVPLVTLFETLGFV